LMGEGEVWRADHEDNHTYNRLWQYYDDRCGQLMDDWVLEHPGGICFVVKAHDPVSDQGRWIGHMLSIDLEDKDGIRTYLDNEQLHYFYVDKDELAEDEVADDGDDWPIGSGCSNPLPADGSPQGELSCWIIRADCVGEYYNSARFRIKDDCGNWTRSENMVPEDQRSGQSEGSVIEITTGESTKFNYDDPVTFTAKITQGNYPGLDTFIQWVILTPNFKSVLAAGTDYTGKTLSFDHIRDCELEVQAFLFWCGQLHEDIDRVTINSDITIKAEAEPYWIDGPSIPIIGNPNPGSEVVDEIIFHNTSIRTVDIVENYTLGKNKPEPQNTCDAPTFTPDLQELKLSQVKFRITTGECIKYIDISTKISGGIEYYEESHVPANSYEVEFWVWHLNNKDNGTNESGTYDVIVKGYTEPNSLDPINEVSKSINLEWVDIEDFIDVLEIYDSDGYLWGGDRCPGYEYTINRDKYCDQQTYKTYTGTVDCSRYVYQGLRRLGRGYDNYNVYFRLSSDWDDWNRVERVGWLDTIQSNEVERGDIILFRNSRSDTANCKHIAIFLAWEIQGESFTVMDADSSNDCGATTYNTVKNTYDVYTWADNVAGENNLPIYH